MRGGGPASAAVEDETHIKGLGMPREGLFSPLEIVTCRMVTSCRVVMKNGASLSVTPKLPSFCDITPSMSQSYLPPRSANAASTNVNSCSVRSGASVVKVARGQKCRSEWPSAAAHAGSKTHFVSAWMSDRRFK